MLSIAFLGLFVLSSIQATPNPQNVQVHRIVQNVDGTVGGALPGVAGSPNVRRIVQNVGGSAGGALPGVAGSPNADPQTKTYTLPDGTVVRETVITEGNKRIVKKEVIRRASSSSSNVQIIDSLGKLPNVHIIKVPGSPDTATIPAQQLLIFLNQQGLSLPSEITQVAGLGKDPNAEITIYLDQLIKILANKDRFSKVPAGRVIYILKQNPNGNGGQPGGDININVNGGGKLPGVNVNVPGADLQVKGSHPSLVNNGHSYLANTGINRRERCDRGLVDETATAIRSTVNGAVGSIADALGSGAIGAVGHGASALITHAISGVDFAIQDAACGLGNIANEIASALDNGDIIGGVGKIGQEFFGGIANMAEDLVSEAGAGVGQAANDIFGFLQDIGK